METAWLGLHRGVLKLLKQSGQQWPERGRQPCSAQLDGLVGVQWAGGFPAPGFAVGCRHPMLLRCFARFHCPCHSVPAIWDRKKWNGRVTQRRITGNLQSPLLLPLYLSDKLCFSSEKHSSWHLTGVRSLSWCWLIFLEVWEKVRSILILSRARKGRQKWPVGGTFMLLHQCDRLLLHFDNSPCRQCYLASSVLY